MNSNSVFGRLTVVCVEVKLEVGTSDEHVDSVAQFIAEADPVKVQGPQMEQFNFGKGDVQTFG